MLPAKKFSEFEPVLAAIADGASIKAACQMHGQTVSKLYRARDADPDFAAELARNREIGADVLADGLQSIHDEIGNPLMARVVSENRRWLLARRHSQKYGDRLAIEDRGRTDLTDILREAIARIPRPISDQPDTIEGENVTIADIFGE